jgi:hypothetical protein
VPELDMPLVPVLPLDPDLVKPVVPVEPDPMDPEEEPIEPDELDVFPVPLFEFHIVNSVLLTEPSLLVSISSRSALNIPLASSSVELKKPFPSVSRVVKLVVVPVELDPEFIMEDPVLLLVV